jgi:hypothetical protein
MEEQEGGQAKVPAAAAATTAAAAAALQVLQRHPAMAMQQLLSRAAEAWQAEGPSSGSVSACQADVAVTAVGGLGHSGGAQCLCQRILGWVANPPCICQQCWQHPMLQLVASSGSCHGRSTCHIRQASRPLPAPPHTSAPQYPAPAVPAALCSVMLLLQLKLRCPPGSWQSRSMQRLGAAAGGAQQKRAFLGPAIAATTQGAAPAVASRAAAAGV